MHFKITVLWNETPCTLVDSSVLSALRNTQKHHTH